jgi:hypothetical protein
MAQYGMKDAANLVLRNKRTGKTEMYIDYANATTNEWKSDRVYATKKGVNAIAWDSARNGTLTLESELFDKKLFAMIAGADVEDGTADVFRRETFTVDATGKATLPSKPDLESLSVYTLLDATEHGVEVPAKAGTGLAIPAMVEGVSITPADKSLALTWTAVEGAKSYIVKRDNQTVGQPTESSYTDANATPETEYHYTVIAVNEAGQSLPSAEVVVSTVAGGAENGAPVTATADAVKAAKDLVKQTATSGDLAFEAAEDGSLTITGIPTGTTQFVAYYMTQANDAQKFTITSDKFADSYEIFADAQVREQESGNDEFLQIHYFNAKPQSNFSLKQSAKEPTSLSIVFDLMPNDKNELAEYTFVK